MTGEVGRYRRRSSSSKSEFTSASGSRAVSAPAGVSSVESLESGGFSSSFWPGAGSSWGSILSGEASRVRDESDVHGRLRRHISPLPE